MFQSITSATARDCIVDEKMDRVIFVVNKGQMGLAIGKGGTTIKQLQNVIPRRIELVEYSDNEDEFLKNILNSSMMNEIKINKRIDGTKQAIVVVDSKKKGVVVGGKKAEMLKKLGYLQSVISTYQMF